MENDLTSELPCTLAIEDSTMDSDQPDNNEQVRLYYIPLHLCALEQIVQICGNTQICHTCLLHVAHYW